MSNKTQPPEDRNEKPLDRSLIGIYAKSTMRHHLQLQYSIYKMMIENKFK